MDRKIDATAKGNAYTQVDDSTLDAVLQALKNAQGRRLTRQQLCHAVYPGEPFTENRDRKIRAAINVLVTERYERIGRGPKGYSYGIFADVERLYKDSHARAVTEMKKTNAIARILAGMGGQIEWEFEERKRENV